MVSENIKIRVKFTKTGRLKFISHLDINRTMKSALLRAKVPMWYSEGFNPRPKIVFALPLSLGVESVCEYMDIRLVERIDFAEIKNKLSSTLEMTVLDVYESDTKFSDIGYAEYKFVFDDPIDAEKLKSPIVVMKRSKSGDKEVDIQPLVKRYVFDGNVMTAVLQADSENYLSPDYLAKALTDGGYDICRINIYMSDGETLFI
jgi:radical SAM-linked protein